jgi:hypothetical protein
VATPTTSDVQGHDVYVRTVGSGFIVVVEAQPGTGRKRVGSATFESDPSDPTVRPDLQILASRPLGNGSLVICDRGPAPAPLGGVPASLLDFGPSQPVADSMNDLACRFDTHESGGDSCTLGVLGVPAFRGMGTTEQFCTAPVVGREISFPNGDTLISVQVRDILGNIGDRRTIVIRVQ